MADIDVTQVLKLLENEEERIVGEITKIETRGPLLDDGEKIGLQAYKNHLAMIADARRQCRAGCYGRCQKCGTPIGQERLAFMPYATLCIECAAPPSAARQQRLSAHVNAY